MGTQHIGDEVMWATMAFHYLSEEFQCRFAIPALGHIAFRPLALVIYSAPQVVCFTVGLHKNPVQVPVQI